MTTRQWLRISAVIAVLFAMGHTIGGTQSWSPMGDNPVLQAMKSTHFVTMGVERTYLDFYMGFGYSIAVFQFTMAILLWRLATLAGLHPKIAQPFILLIAIATALCGCIAYEFLFPVPAYCSLALTVSILVSYFLARKIDPIAYEIDRNKSKG